MNAQGRQVVAIAEALGFTFERHGRGGHLVFRHPGTGAQVTVPCTPSEYRGLRNAQLQLERAAGKRLPRVRKGRSHKAVKGSGFDLDRAAQESAAWHNEWGDDVDRLASERQALIERCQQLAQSRSNLRCIPPLLTRIEGLERQLAALHQHVEPFDPFTLA